LEDQDREKREVHTVISDPVTHEHLAEYDFALVLSAGTVIELEPKRSGRSLIDPERFEVTGVKLKLGKDRCGNDVLEVSVTRVLPSGS
jgi:hypothetical protein